MTLARARAVCHETGDGGGGDEERAVRTRRRVGQTRSAERLWTSQEGIDSVITVRLVSGVARNARLERVRNVRRNRVYVFWALLWADEGETKISLVMPGAARDDVAHIHAVTLRDARHLARPRGGHKLAPVVVVRRVGRRGEVVLVLRRRHGKVVDSLDARRLARGVTANVRQWKSRRKFRRGRRALVRGVAQALVLGDVPRAAEVVVALWTIRNRPARHLARAGRRRVRRPVERVQIEIRPERRYDVR